MVRSEEGRTVNIRRVTRFNRIKSLLTLRRFTPVTRTAIDPMNNVKPSFCTVPDFIRSSMFFIHSSASTSPLRALSLTPAILEKRYRDMERRSIQQMKAAVEEKGYDRFIALAMRLDDLEPPWSTEDQGDGEPQPPSKRPHVFTFCSRQMDVVEENSGLIRDPIITICELSDYAQGLDEKDKRKIKKPTR
ncbi:hypothetical protein OUZ56_021712 [Daphnia magna]|uniref:Uncharacterized protein n=1 Tax=Daphnia magna TaxID=35525 RepID=A0ABR0AUB1_9CRUS|nr:hypothetical protein OUZ56_021712 [Daphnia magna]